jgi:hypothetical protein
MLEISLGDVEKRILDGIPLEIFVCFLMLLVSTLTLFRFGVLDWTIGRLELLDNPSFLIEAVILIPAIFLFLIGFVLPLVYFFLYLERKRKLDTL